MATHRGSPLIFKCPSPACGFRGTARKDHLLRHVRKFHKTENWRIQIERSVTEERMDRPVVDDLELLTAVHQGHVEKMNELILAGGDIAVTDKMGSTLLHLGSAAGNIAMVNLLLENGADVNINAYNKRGTALFMAAENGHEAMVKLLLQHGANINAKFYKTPASIAAENGHDAVAKLLLWHGAHIDVRYLLNRPSLFLAARGGH